MRHLDLFSGIGGFAYAAQQVWGDEHKIVAFCEIDKFCQKVLKKHWPDTRIVNDIKELKGYEYEADIITAGFPCQDFSNCQRGTRTGLAGDRSGLWYELERIIDECPAQWIVIENVSNILTQSNGRGFARILQTLVDFGYCVAWRILDARYFGVPCTRKRMFLVASFANDDCSRVLFRPNEIGTVLQKEQATGDIKPMCLGWDGGLSYERLRQCVLTKTYPTGTGTSNGVSRQLDKYRYRAMKNTIVPQVAAEIMKSIKEINARCLNE